jgi:carboxylate-amine ligase
VGKHDPPTSNPEVREQKDLPPDPARREKTPTGRINIVIMASHPTFGVEEEFLLVDPATGEPVAVNKAVASSAAELGVKLQLELTSCQVETTSEVVSSSDDLVDELTRLRRAAAQAAEANGAQLLAAALPPTRPHEFPITDNPRYRQIADKFGRIAEEGICGAHVHVAVPSREVAVRVSNRLRPWLPLLLALTANSAVYRDADTGYASWRSIVWSRWPSAGPPPHFDSVDEYDAMVRMLLRAGAVIDDGMVYWDVRPSAKFPTVEVRVADVPATVNETVLLAMLIRASVMMALEDDRRGEPSPPLSPHALKAAYWKSARDGLDGEAVDLLDSHAPISARKLLQRMVDHVRPALEDVGDYQAVTWALTRLDRDGNGAMRQRRAWSRRQDAKDVVADLAAATLSRAR